MLPCTLSWTMMDIARTHKSIDFIDENDIADPCNPRMNHAWPNLEGHGDIGSAGGGSKTHRIIEQGLVGADLHQHRWESAQVRKERRHTGVLPVKRFPFSTKLCVYSDMPSFSSQWARFCIAPHPQRRLLGLLQADYRKDNMSGAIHYCGFEDADRTVA
jgi:hypothetical protein